MVLQLLALALCHFQKDDLIVVARIAFPMQATLGNTCLLSTPLVIA
jgi:hypothetical protein